MSSYYNLLASKKRAAFPPSLLLDLYPSASVAYSLRKLRTAYSGNAIRVRRSSDNAEQDIAFVSNELDTTSMLNFVGYNLWTYSEDISNAVWSKLRLNTTGTPAYIDVETAPDGTLTGDKIIEATGTANTHYINRATQTLINGIDYNVSVYLKQSERTNVRIASNIAGVTQDCYLDLTNGSISSNTFTNTPIVTTEANGWYRFSVTITSGTTSSTFPLSVNLLNASNQLSYSGDGISGCYVWGYQLSQTSTVKTYQKTVAIVAGNGFVTTWYDQSGNGNNVRQTTAIRQPLIVSAGVVNVLNGKPSILSNSTFTALQSINLFTFSQVYISTVFNRIARVGINDSLYIWNGSPFNQLYSNTTFWTGFVGVNQNTNISLSVNQKLLTQNNNGTTNIYYDNSVQTSSLNQAFTITNKTLEIFGYTASTYGTRGNMQEFIMYGTSQSSNRAGIETNINSFYTIY